jgi:hypothetical protein
MIIRMTLRSAACLSALALFGVLAVTSIRLDIAAQEMAAASQEIAGAPALAGMDIPALTATAGKTSLPLLSVHDPI